MLPRTLAIACLAAFAGLASFAQTPGKKLAVVVGVNEYKGDLMELAYAENDAEEMDKELRKAGYTVTLLTTKLGKKDAAKMPTADNIRKVIGALVKGREAGDTVMVCLAGHGMELEVDDPLGKEASRTYPYFCPHDHDPSGIRFETGNAPKLINLNWLFGEFRSSAAGRKVVLVDACRNLGKVKAARRNINANEVTVPKGVCAMFSCSSGQFAYEIKDLGGRGHGVFFHFVLEALRGEAKNAGGAVTWSRLTEYVAENVEKKVKEAVAKKQTPHQVTNVVGVSPVLVTGVKAIAVVPPVLVTGVKAIAGEADYQRAMDFLGGRGVSLDDKKSAGYMKKASDAGHPLAQGCYTWMLHHGWAVDKNEIEAGKLVRGCLEKVKEAGKSKPDAMWTLGIFHRDGIGVERDDTEAAVWFRKAADKGQPMGMNDLAFMYESGRGVKQDAEEAAVWFRKAADKEFGWAMSNLAFRYSVGRGLKQDDKEAVAWWRKAAAKEDPLGMSNLGLMYEQGRGVEKDETEAIRWYRKAAARNVAGAKAGLERLGVKE